MNLQIDKCIEVTGIWDTGAFISCISQRVVDQLQLNEIKEIKYHTPDGIKKSSTYNVSVILPNNEMIENLIVIKKDFNPERDADMLIGMDIITMGDFVISNFEGKTIMSFRSPSSGHINFDD